VRREVLTDIARQWTVKEMAKIAHLSPSRFAHVYREVFGQAPLADLLEARVEHASWLLMTENTEAKEVAAKSGFSSTQHFCRIFERYMGCTPKEFSRRRK
jgi:AraC-like DNA-binding protein